MVPAALSRAMAAYAATPQAQTGEAGTAAGSSFSDLIKAELGQTVEDLRGGEKLTIASATGRADIQQVVEAVAQAELSLQKITAVRDRVIASYQEIMRMPI
jgi:flagellar hook-basal body complex protein FliE